MTKSFRNAHMTKMAKNKCPGIRTRTEKCIFGIKTEGFRM
jgi:hypothetical protein